MRAAALRGLAGHPDQPIGRRSMNWIYTLTLRAPKSESVPATPREQNVRIRQEWSRLQANLHRQSIKLQGLRCVCPQACGAPVWEIVLCFPDADAAQLAILAIDAQLAAGTPDTRAVQCGYSVAGVQIGAMKRYAARYLSKPDDVRVEKWACAWGIRRHVRIGAGLPELVGGGA